MFPVANNFYAQWRLQSGAIPLLCERADSPPERLLQAIWQHQRLLRDQLFTLDGIRIRILHPGFWNKEGGPDFQGAVVQFGDLAPATGDVEVDLQAGGWHAHGHDVNPAFKKVILQVIWDAPGFRAAQKTERRAGRPARAVSRAPLSPEISGTARLKPPPALMIGSKLDAPVGELSMWLSSESADSLPEKLRGQCGPQLRELSDAQLAELLRQAAEIRFRSKASQLQSRARQVGWEQSLWEGLFRALGYKHNTWPMQCLAEQRQRWLGETSSPLALQARLLGIGGLLPMDLTRAQASADSYLRRVWDQWWREREEFDDCLLPRSLWRFHGQRPANHPQRRLALAAHWLVTKGLPARLERWCAADLSDDKLTLALLELLQIESDDFWCWHWTVRSPRLERAQPLLGAARVTDLAVNVILPWLWIRAVEGKNSKLQTAIEHRFHVWPAGEDNAVLKLARQRLLGSGARRHLRKAAEQQGLMQIVRDFCDHSNAICNECQFPELVTKWSVEQSRQS